MSCWHREETPDPTFKYTLTNTLETLAVLQEAQQYGIAVRETATDRIEIEVASPIDAHLEKLIYGAVPAAERDGVAEAIKSYQDARYSVSGHRPGAGRHFMFRGSARKSRVN